MLGLDFTQRRLAFLKRAVAASFCFSRVLGAPLSALREKIIELLLRLLELGLELVIWSLATWRRRACVPSACPGARRLRSVTAARRSLVVAATF